MSTELQTEIQEKFRKGSSYLEVQKRMQPRASRETPQHAHGQLDEVFWSQGFNKNMTTSL